MSRKRKPPKPRLSVADKSIARQELRKLLAAEYDKQASAIADQMADCTMLVIAMLLRDDEEWEVERITSFLRRYLFQFNCIVDDYVQFDDIKSYLRDERGLDMEKIKALIDQEG